VAGSHSLFCVQNLEDLTDPLVGYALRARRAEPAIHGFATDAEHVGEIALADAGGLELVLELLEDGGVGLGGDGRQRRRPGPRPWGRRLGISTGTVGGFGMDAVELVEATLQLLFEVDGDEDVELLAARGAPPVAAEVVEHLGRLAEHLGDLELEAQVVDEVGQIGQEVAVGLGLGPGTVAGGVAAHLHPTEDRVPLPSRAPADLVIDVVDATELVVAAEGVGRSDLGRPLLATGGGEVDGAGLGYPGDEELALGGPALALAQGGEALGVGVGGGLAGLGRADGLGLEALVVLGGLEGGRLVAEDNSPFGIPLPRVAAVEEVGRENGEEGVRGDGPPFAEDLPEALLLVLGAHFVLSAVAVEEHVDEPVAGIDVATAAGPCRALEGCEGLEAPPDEGAPHAARGIEEIAELLRVETDDPVGRRLDGPAVGQDELLVGPGLALHVEGVEDALQGVEAVEGRESGYVVLGPADVGLELLDHVLLRHDRLGEREGGAEGFLDAPDLLFVVGDEQGLEGGHGLDAFLEDVLGSAGQAVALADLSSGQPEPALGLEGPVAVAVEEGHVAGRLVGPEVHARLGVAVLVAEDRVGPEDEAGLDDRTALAGVEMVVGDDGRIRRLHTRASGGGVEVALDLFPQVATGALLKAPDGIDGLAAIGGTLPGARGCQAVDGLGEEGFEVGPEEASGFFEGLLAGLAVEIRGLLVAGGHEVAAQAPEGGQGGGLVDGPMGQRDGFEVEFGPVGDDEGGGAGPVADRGLGGEIGAEVPEEEQALVTLGRADDAEGEVGPAGDVGLVGED